MERWERAGKPTSNRARNYPSFSSTLLDSIYRSIDETDGGPAIDRHTSRATDSTTKWTAVRSEKPVSKSKASDHRHRYFHSTSSSSECSSYGGFSSSEAESAAAAAHPARLKPIRTGGLSTRSERIRSDPPPPLPMPAEKKKASSIRSRFRDLRKSRAPASPGARLASFINSLFAAGGNLKKTKTTTPSTGAGGGEESTCSTASSYSRSCLSKTPSSSSAVDGIKRSVRFYPVSVIVDEDCRPCGQKCIYDEDPAVRRTPAAAVKKKRVDELIREFEEEDDDAASDSSSDLFELENLSVIGRYRDELPVYETTHPVTNRAIAQGLIL